jgi:GNAT superfamily N-acetyltransferase
LNAVTDPRPAERAPIATAFKIGGTRQGQAGDMTHHDVTPTIVLRSGYEPGVIGRIGELHGRYYAVAWGSGAAFEIQMLRALCAFVEEYDPRTHVLLTAHAGDALIGSAAVLRFPETGRAQLRWVIVDPAWQGHGAGRALLQAALDWCRERGVEVCFLWTVEGLPTSRAMYERAGFRVIERVEDARYSVPRTSIRMELPLEAAPADAQSVRSARIGEIDAARRAGRMAATNADAASANTPAPSASGSQNDTPYSCADSR